LARAVALALLASLVPLPALAGDTSRAPKPQTLQAAIAKAAAQEAPKVSRAASKAVVQTAGTDNPDLSKWAFFKSPVGVAVIGILAVGTGYALYSTKHDRILAPGR
jgi:hypothetical protein